MAGASHVAAVVWYAAGTSVLTCFNTAREGSSAPSQGPNRSPYTIYIIVTAASRSKYVFCLYKYYFAYIYSYIFIYINALFVRSVLLQRGKSHLQLAVLSSDTADKL